MGLPSGSAVKKLPAMQKMQVWSLGWEDPLEKCMATHSSIPAREISWTEEPRGLQSIESQSWTRLKQLRERVLSSEESVVIWTIYTHTYKYTSLKMGIHTVCVPAKSLQSCLTLCDPMDRSPPGSSVHGISQAGILEWGAISSSRGSSWARDRTLISGISCPGSRVLYH